MSKFTWTDDIDLSTIPDDVLLSESGRRQSARRKKRRGTGSSWSHARRMAYEKRRMRNAVYECDICCCYHPWVFDGDCRDDDNRYISVEEFADSTGINTCDVVVYSMEDRNA